MRVRMEVTMAGPTGTFLAGQVADLPDAEARALLAAGYARPIEAAKPAAAPGPVESAMLEPAAEKAVEERPSPRRGRPPKRGRRGGLDAADADESA